MEGRLLAALKPTSRGTLGGKENLLYFLGQQTGRKADSGPTADTRLPVSGQELLKAEFQGYMGGRGPHAEMAQAAPTLILNLVIGGLIGVLLIKYNPSSVSGSVCSRFLEVTFPNCGSLCCGQELPSWCGDRESASNAGDAGDAGSIPGSGSSSGGGNGNPLQYSCSGNPKDRGDWRAAVHGAAKSQP